MEENRINLRGRATRGPAFSHESHGKRFCSLTVAVPRLSGTADELNLLLPEELAAAIEPGDWLAVEGEVRSFNNRSGVGSRLVITVFVQSLALGEDRAENALALTGVLCKPPVYRRTPLGREICDLMLAVPRKYGRADYLPCIAWGAMAGYASGLGVGDRVSLTGRLQSRSYTKSCPEGPVEKTAFEISITDLRKQG